MKIAIQDANILMDLANGDFLAAWFALGIETHTTDLVMVEIKDAVQKKAVTSWTRQKCLVVHDADASALGEIAQAAARHQISMADASILRLAIALKATLVSGDGRLRKIAGPEVEVCGLLKVLDLIAGHRSIQLKEMAAGLRKIMEAGSYLPADECEIRIRKWSS